MLGKERLFQDEIDFGVTYPAVMFFGKSVMIGRVIMILDGIYF